MEPETLSLADLARLLTAGELTSESLTGRFLDRITTLDGAGPHLRSVIEVNGDAIEIARSLDRERVAGHVRGPLHGVPVLLKDNIDTGDRMATTAGSLALVGAPAAQDAPVAARLRAAGAVILGKTNLSEWANFRSSASSSGWSGRGGQTLNPYDRTRSPGGSSSGSGASVAAGLAAGAIGTETDGSILNPATFNGVVGIKPTVGLTSRRGVIPISHSQDTVGPLARSVADAATILTAIAGPDDGDPATANAPSLDYTSFLQHDGLRGARIGVPRTRYWGYSAHADAACERALELMRDAGAEIVDGADIPTADEMSNSNAEMEVLLYEFKAGLNRYLASRSGVSVQSLADVIAFNDEHATAEMRYFGQDILIQAQKKGDLDDPAYRDALSTSRRLAGPEGIDAALRAHRLDALVAPTGAPAFTIDLVNGDHHSGGSSGPCARAGYPAISVPAGLAFGLPIGITFMGTAWSEPVLVRLAYAFETLTGPLIPPDI